MLCLWALAILSIPVLKYESSHEKQIQTPFWNNSGLSWNWLWPIVRKWKHGYRFSNCRWLGDNGNFSSHFVPPAPGWTYCPARPLNAEGCCEKRPWRKKIYYQYCTIQTQLNLFNQGNEFLIWSTKNIIYYLKIEKALFGAHRTPKIDMSCKHCMCTGFPMDHWAAANPEATIPIHLLCRYTWQTENIVCPFSFNLQIILFYPL